MTTTPGSPWQPPSAEELQKTLPQYEVAQMLGRGGMGAVYMGRQISLDRPVAIKILSGELEDADAGFTERFKNEAKAMAKLNHPGIVSVYDFGETEGGLLYIVMEYVDGTDVSRMIAANGRIHTEHAMAITAHVCDALAYAHERGIIHRDIKPANIMVGYDGSVKVADFGLAKVSTANGSTMGLTQSGMAMGTLHFMAPEALILGASVDHRADIYAVGVMLYQMLTGKLPQGMFKMPSLQIAGIDPRYDGIVAMAMMEDRESRYQSARDMRAGLDGILTQPVIQVEPAPAGAASPAALPTQARPQRPGGAVRQPYRPPQSRVVVQTEKRGSLMYWVVAVALSAAVVWMVFDRNKQTAGEGVAEAQDTADKTSAPTKIADSDPQSVLIPLPSVPNSPTAPTKPVTAPITNAYAWLHGTWTQSHGTPPTPALSMELRSDYTAEMTAGGKTVQGRWNLSGKKLGINWANGHLHEIIVSTPDAVTELTGKGTPPQGGSFPLIYRKGVPPPVPAAAVAMVPKPTGTAFTNSLGMKFIDVLGTEVQFCIHETRRRDYAAYASATPGVDTQWQNPVFENVPLAVGEDHPVSQISWEEAKAFCDWLSKKEGRKYRLPTDREWSVATGLGDIEPPDRDTASVNSLNTKHVYPWGTAWPPPAGVGNFADTALAKAYRQKRILNGYSDGFATTAPVMSFKPNAVGLYDMAGNVQEFCNDLAGWGKTERIRRSSSFVDHFASGLASSMRSNVPLTSRYELTGFRCVLELGKTATTSNSSLPQPAAPPPSATPTPAHSLKDVLVGRWKAGPNFEWAYEFGADKILTIHGSSGVPMVHQWIREGETVVWNSHGGVNTLDFQPPGTLRGTSSRGVAMVLERSGDLPAPTASATLWIDSKKRPLKASFVRLEGDKVVLDIAGKQTPVPLATLTDESQKISTALHAAASPTTPRLGDPRPATLAKDLAIVKISLGAGPISAGARLSFSAAVKNVSSNPVILPFSERAAIHGVSHQLWIERLGRNKEIPFFQSGKKGDWYAVGGNQVSLRSGESVLQAGEEMVFRQPILTQGFPAGKYRIHVELEPLDSEEIFTQAELDFELTP